MRPSSGKQFLLEHLSFERLTALADKSGFVVRDSRLRAPGLIKLLSRKRSLTAVEVANHMTAEELRTVAARLGVDHTCPPRQLRVQIAEAAAGDGWRSHRRAASRLAGVLEVHPAELLTVVDGDTITVRWEYGETTVRLRGVDAAETGTSDKAERELDASRLDSAAMRGLGERATARLRVLTDGRPLFLHCQPTPGGGQRYLHHHQYRLLAYITLDAPDGPDLGGALIAEGYALVWPRNVVTRRYLHPKNLEYVRLCSTALNDRPGLWASGLSQLCPRFTSRNATWTLDDCRTACFRKDWRDVEATPPDDTARER